MVDFAKAIEAGMQAHEEAMLARKEIRGVFQDLIDQTSAATHGSVRTFVRPPPDSSEPRRVGTPPPPESYESVVVQRDSTEQRHVLFEFRLSEKGYPVRLRYPRNEVGCYSREDLEAALQNLLASPHAGAIFRRLLDDSLESSVEGESGTRVSVSP